ncbi:MAG: hypothetical protein M1825_001834 [Sarcosagium campestre]|nr:MAG: hypothetical protein M1825_001834 [Sarcosagium campestre]
MFKKKPNIKPLAPLRSSDRRRTADQIISDLQIPIQASDVVGENGAQAEHDQQKERAAADAAALTQLRNTILPESSLSARFTTTAGPDLKLVSGTVFVGAHGSDEQRILWLRLDDRMYPTVYTLWHNPRIVPLLHTIPDVLQKMRSGADLMTPGLANGPPFPPGARKGSIVAVASNEQPSVPLVVGVCEIDVANLTHVRGEKGRAVHTFHWAGDELWNWSAVGLAGTAPPDTIEDWIKSDDVRSQSANEGLSKLSINEHTKGQDGTEDLAQDHDDSAPDERNKYVEGEDVDAAENIDHKPRELTTKEVDDIFHKALLYGIYQQKMSSKHDSQHGLKFPLSSSFVISSLVLPFIPPLSPGQASSVQIKKTSWKSAKKFIKTVEKEGILKAKDRSGEVVVTEIDFEHAGLVGFVPYKLAKKESNAGTVSNEPKGDGNPHAAGDTVGQQLKRVGLYRPKDKLSPIFQNSDQSAKNFFLASELRPIITAYVESESLVVPNNRRLIKLDPILANAVFDSNSSTDREVLAKGTVPRETLIDRVIHECSPYWIILKGNEGKDDAKPKAGAAPSIKILLETRSGNKTVTKVSGVEAYYINPQPLAEELQKTCASSTSVNQLVGSSPKAPVMEILVQGPQTQAVTKALEKRGVNKQWIEVLDKTKGKKR